MGYHVDVILVGMVMITCAAGHGRLIVPPARNALWRVQHNMYNVPMNTNDMGLNCGGQGVSRDGLNCRVHCGMCGEPEKSIVVLGLSKPRKCGHIDIDVFGDPYEAEVRSTAVVNVAWSGTNRDGRGNCGVCGDAYNAPVRENEAGGKFATGTIAQTYREGQIITVVLASTVAHGGWYEFRIFPNNNTHRAVTQDCLDKHLLRTVGAPRGSTTPPTQTMSPCTCTNNNNNIIRISITVAHGGWSEFRICPNNNIHRAVTQDCLDKHLLRTIGGATRFYHPTHTGNVTVHLLLPKGVTCTQCVMQWWWKSNSNNNCRPATGKDCCIACGPQELFVNCADIAIGTTFKPYIPTIAPAIPPTTRAPPTTVRAVPTTTRAVRTTKAATRAPHTTAVPKTNRPSNNALPDRFMPIENKSTGPGVPSTGSTKITDLVSGFWPIDIGSEKCAGTKLAHGLYGRQLADHWCQSQCVLGTCPVRLCTEACRH